MVSLGYQPLANNLLNRKDQECELYPLELNYCENCHNCHGPAGMGVASYPKVSGKDFSYIVDKLNRYRSGEKIGPNSALMISMAKKLSDTEIQILAAYLSSVK